MYAPPAFPAGSILVRSKSDGCLSSAFLVRAEPFRSPSASASFPLLRRSSRSRLGERDVFRIWLSSSDRLLLLRRPLSPPLSLSLELLELLELLDELEEERLPRFLPSVSRQAGPERDPGSGPAVTPRLP